MQHLLIAVASFAIVANALADRSGGVDQSALRITLPGVGPLGVFDPSVTEDPATGRLWMSFSALSASKHSRWGVSLHLAYSDDGEAWHDGGSVQKFADVTVGPLPVAALNEDAIEADSRGTWQNETSTIVYDRAAPREQRWKLFWHQALWVENPRYASYSWIALRMADAPENLAGATPIKLFTGYLAKTQADAADGPAFAPIDGPPAIELNRRDPQLGGCLFGEPGALSTSDALYLTVDCQWLGSTPQPFTTLLRCAYPGCVVTDASSWTVVNRLTDPRDAQKIDERYRGFGGTSLVEKGGKYYLLATPVAAKTNRYDGCLVFPFEDLASGKLERSRGRLIHSRAIRGIPETHNGACAFHPRLKHGVLLSQLVVTAAPAMFQIRGTGIDIP